MNDIVKKYAELNDQLSWVKNRLSRTIYIIMVQDKQFVHPRLFAYRKALLWALIHRTADLRRQIDEICDKKLCFHLQSGSGVATGVAMLAQWLIFLGLISLGAG